jgi:hypothetical protein
MSDFLELAILDGATPSTLSLPELERVIERGQQTFIEVGRALLEIRDRRLYRETHATFEAYCRERWGWSRRHANRQIEAARVVDAVGPVGPKPESERQARAMLDRLEPEERKAVREGTTSPRTVQKMTEPIRRPKRETPDEHTQVIELVRHHLTQLRKEYALVSYWQPVWDAIDALNRGSK